MIHPFDETYLYRIQEKFSNLIDYLYYYQKLDYQSIEKILCKSKYVKFLLDGNPYYSVGKSSVEIIKIIEEEFNLPSIDEEYVDTFEKTPQYWAGYALSYYCYEMFKDFNYIFYSISLEKIIYMYKVYHEMDIMRFVENFDKMLKNGHKETNLRIIRLINNMSQSELSNKSGVSLRNIQLYEQRVNSIDRAQVQTLFKLATVLHCSIEDLLENPSL